MFQLIKTLLKTAVVAVIAILAAAVVEWEGTRITRHAERIVDAVIGSKTLQTLQQETAGHAGSLMRDAREGAETIQRLREASGQTGKKAGESAGAIIQDFDRITRENQKQLQELIEERTDP